jgi:hypothetical protein
MAQENVQALRYFTKADNGLTQSWHGTVYLNPPYAQPHIENFADKMIDEVTAGHVTASQPRMASVSSQVRQAR